MRTSRSNIVRHPRADGQGELRPRAQPGVRRDGFLHVDPDAFPEVETLRQRLGIARRARPVRPVGRRQPESGLRRTTGEGSLQSEPETSVPATLAAVEIDEAHVQPGGRPNDDMMAGAIRHAGAEAADYSNRLCR